MKRFIILFLCLGMASNVNAISSKTIDKETMQLCIKYFKEIEKLKDIKRHDEARKYRSEMHNLDCPTRHNDYYK